MEEPQAIVLLKQGDLRGLEYLVSQYQVQAVQAAYLVVGDRCLAEDICQSAFLRVVEKIDQFDHTRPFRPWFLRIVINAAIKSSRRMSRQVSLDTAADLEIEPGWLVDPGAGPEELADNAETRRAVWKALEQLTTRQRAAVVMRYYLELSDPEISSELGRPLTAVKWALHAARERLRRLLHAFAPSGAQGAVQTGEAAQNTASAGSRLEREQGGER